MMPYCIETLTVKEEDAMNIYQPGTLGGEAYGGHVMRTLLAVCIYALTREGVDCKWLDGAREVAG